jgi:transcriptional regulator with XRE-family HTH domain
MTGPELHAALDALGMSQREFARRFGLLEGSVSRWAQGHRAVPSWVPGALALLHRARRPSRKRKTQQVEEEEGSGG